MDIINDIYKHIHFYRLPTVYGNDFTKKVLLPTNMYQMPLIYDQYNEASDQTSGQTSQLLVDPKLFEGVDKQLAENAIKDLLSRQELLLSRVESLEKRLDELDGDNKAS